MRGSYVLKQLPNGDHELVPKDEVAAWVAAHYPQRATGTPFHVKRVQRGSWVWRDGKLVAKSAQVIQFRPRSFQVIKDIEPFRNVAVDRNEIIGGRRQKRDMMKARNLVEAGDIPTKYDACPQPKYDAKAHRQSVVNSLKHALHKHGLGD
jgi:hypothetical protein